MNIEEITQAAKNLKAMAERLEGLLPENNMFARAYPEVDAHIRAELAANMGRQLDAISHESKRLLLILAA